MSLADIHKVLQESTRTIESLNFFEEWLDSSAQLAEKGEISPVKLRTVLERYRAARYLQTPAQPGR